MPSSKTTLYLSATLHRRLKALAGRTGTTISRLLEEGAEWVLARSQGTADVEDLAKRAKEAEEELRAGLYEGPAVSRSADDVAYPRASKPAPDCAGPE